jgi:NAD(P)-dependent dehydrogenase (short-subunit alcohol dehydrogenase family)
MSGTAPIRFDGQVAIVTGAGGGMGSAYARELARRGAAVLVNDYGGGVLGEQDGSAAPAERVAAEIMAAGGRAVADAHAVGSGAAARAIVQAAIDAFGRVDILVNNAGVALPGPFTAFADEAIEQHYRINLIGAHHLMRAAWPGMAAQGYGRILNISSNGALGVGGNAPYATAKAGILGLSLDAAIEGRPAGILVNALMPTAYSRMIEQIPDRATVRWFAKHMQPEKVAAAAAWFLSRACTVSGRVLIAGGGRLSSLVFAETGELFDPAIDAEQVAGAIGMVLDESSLAVTHDQATAGARYMRMLPWEEGDGPDFGADMTRG